MDVNRFGNLQDRLRISYRVLLVLLLANLATTTRADTLSDRHIHREQAFTPATVWGTQPGNAFAPSERSIAGLIVHQQFANELVVHSQQGEFETWNDHSDIAQRERALTTPGAFVVIVNGVAVVFMLDAPASRSTPVDDMAQRFIEYRQPASLRF